MKLVSLLSLLLLVLFFGLSVEQQIIQMTDSLFQRSSPPGHPSLQRYQGRPVVQPPPASNRQQSPSNGNGNHNKKATTPRSQHAKLMKKIFNTYVKEAMPERPVVVHFDMLLFKLKASVEKDGIFESVVGLFLEWQDRRMEWNPADYDNVTLLMFDADRLWLPDIAMTNSADHLYAIIRDTRFVIRVTHDGMFRFVPTGTARTWCDFKLLTFPFDFQTCSLKFESWSMNSSTMTFDWESRLLLDSQFSSTEWELCQHRAITYDHIYEFTNETFTRVEYEFIIKRKSTFYVINLILPCATLSIIQLSVFFISSTDTTADRIGFGTTNLLTLVVFQTIVTAEMPKTSDAVTALSKYIIALIMLSTIGIFESVFVERMLSTVLNPPSWLLARCLQFIPVLWREKPDKLQFRPRHSTDFSRRSAVLPRISPTSIESMTMGSSESWLPEPIFNKQLPDQTKNALLWTEVAYRIDFLTFITSASLALFIPFGLFAPLFLVSEQCSDNAKDLN